MSARRASWAALALLGLLPVGLRAQDAPPAGPAAPAPEAPAAAPVVAGPGQVAIEARFGFAGKVSRHGFVPVEVALTPQGPERTVTVVLQAVESLHVLLRLGPIELDGPRRLAGTVAAHALGDAGQVLVTVESGGEVLGQAVQDVEVVAGELVVVLDRRGPIPADLSGIRCHIPVGYDAGGTAGRVTPVVVASLDELPATPLGWSGVGAVVLGDLELEGWGEDRARALAGWVARGGTLIVSVGPRASLLKRSLLGRRLAFALVDLPDAEPRRDVPLPELEGPDGARGRAPAVARLQGPVADGGSASGSWAGAAVLYRDEAGNPLAVVRPALTGRAVLLGPDLWEPPFLHSPATPRLLEELLTLSTQHVPRTRILFRELAQVHQPARLGVIFALLIAFALVAGPGAYFLLRARGRGLLLWVAIPALTLLFTAATPLYRVALREAESTLVGVRLVEMRSGEDLALETTDVKVFSGSLEPKRLELRGEDALSFAVVPPRNLSKGTPELGQVLAPGPEGGQAAYSLPIALWGARYVSFERTLAAPPVSGAVELTCGPEDGSRPQSAHLRLRYGGARPLWPALVVWSGPHGVLVDPLEEPLEPGDIIERDLLPMPPGSYVPGKDLGGAVMAELLSEHYQVRAELLRTAFLIGVSDEPLGVRAFPNVRTRAGATILAVELPVAYRDAVPSGFSRSVELARTLPGQREDTVRRELVSRFLLPPAAPGPRPDPTAVKLILPGARPAALRALRLEVRRWGDDGPAWVPVTVEADAIDAVPREGGQVHVPLPEPGRAVSPAGEVWVRQVFERGRQDPDPARVSIGVRVDWR